MRTILAGWIAGYIMAISVTVSMSWLIVKTPANTSKASILGSDVDSRIAYVFIHLGASLACTILGLIVGTIYHITVIRQVGVHSFEPLFLIGVLVDFFVVGFWLAHPNTTSSAVNTTNGYFII